MPQPIPLLVYSDGPRLPTGLARITRDLCTRIHAEAETLGVSLLQVGYDPLPGPTPAWPLWAIGQMDMREDGDWGAELLPAAWRYQFGDAAGIIFSVWDPGRSYAVLTATRSLPIDHLWGYFPIDGWNVNQTLSGPAREAIERYDRVLAYGRWGSEVLATIRRPVPYLPHGIDLTVWTCQQRQDVLARAETILRRREGDVVIGCVATNQPRKDLALYLATLAELRTRGHKVRGWLHTDKLIRAWCVQQLVADYGLAKRVTVTLALEDWELSACYACCGVTIAPGLGEGFGYPLVESLACGTPVVHGDYAGGAELVPLNAWRVPARTFRVDGIYNILRPVISPTDCANAVERALDWRRHDERTCQAYCRGAVEHLEWRHLWGRWRSWIKQGVETLQ